MSKNYDVVLIPGKYDKKIVLPDIVIKKLPNKLILFGSVQFLYQLEEIQKQLESSGRTVLTKKSKNYLYEGLITDKGQLLGCNMEDFSSKEDFDAFLYIGDGVFHPKALLVNNEKDVYCYDPKINKLSILEKKLHAEYVRKVKGAKLKFLNSKNIGLLITTKMGQGSPKRAMKLKENILSKWPEKKVFVFYADEINFMELENFNFIDIYVNVACSRIGHDDTARSEKAIINIRDAEELLKY
ncbi:MAG: diphthamide synthesis protein [Candidatus Woesearchaeota archaeon]